MAGVNWSLPSKNLPIRSSRGGIRPITERTRFRLDAVGRLEIASVFVYAAALVGSFTTKFAHDVSDEIGYSERSWLIGLAVGVLAGAAAVILALWTCRRCGGQRLMRLGRRAWYADELPTTVSMRIAVLRDLERRDRALEKHAPRLLFTILWAIFATFQLARDASVVNITAWGLLFAAVAAGEIVDYRNRRRWRHLRTLIRTLRDDPTGIDASAHPSRPLQSNGTTPTARHSVSEPPQARHR